MGRFLTPQDFIAQFGEDEARAIAGSGDFNSLEGSLIDEAQIEREIKYADDLIAGYVLARHSWLNGVAVADAPDLLKGFGGDIVRYRLRDKQSNRGQIFETVRDRYHDAIAKLKDIQAGRLDLPRDIEVDDGPAQVSPTLSQPGAAISGPPPRSDDILRGY